MTSNHTPGPESSTTPHASSHDANTTVQALKDSVVAFSDAREWGRFHRPGELAKALSVEASELLQLFLWTDDRIPGARPEPDRSDLSDELADVAICLLNLAHRADIDLASAIAQKLARNAQKYPVDKVRGQARKYNEYDPEPGEGRQP